MYKCKLINKQGYIIESFYREGSSISDVLESLSSYEWQDGEWVVEEI